MVGMRLDHIAVNVDSIDEAICWYNSYFDFKILYKDDSWAMLDVSNPKMKIALVAENKHPNHIGIECNHIPDFAKSEPEKYHRDGSQFIYKTDPWGNSWEWLIYPKPEYYHFQLWKTNFNEAIGCCISENAEKAVKDALPEKEWENAYAVKVDKKDCDNCKEDL